MNALTGAPSAKLDACEPSLRVLAVISTKGGVGKTTAAANLGGYIADAGLRVLLVDLDVQPTLSSYFTLSRRAEGGIYELLGSNEQHAERVISRTEIPNLDVVISNDDRGQLNTLLLHAPDGRLRLRNLLRVFEPHYDLMLLDTQGARSVLLEMAVLASTDVLSPVTPEVLAARELRRGTFALLEDIAPYRRLGIQLPPLQLLINRVHPVSSNARMIAAALREVIEDEVGLKVLSTDIPAIEAYPRAAILGLPVHRVEPRRPAGRVAPAAAETIRSLACELFPHWRSRFEVALETPGRRTCDG
jgi:chromosome partitioning related protein ParA